LQLVNVIRSGRKEPQLDTASAETLVIFPSQAGMDTELLIVTVVKRWSSWQAFSCWVRAALPARGTKRSRISLPDPVCADCPVTSLTRRITPKPCDRHIRWWLSSSCSGSGAVELGERPDLQHGRKSLYVRRNPGATAEFGVVFVPAGERRGFAELTSPAGRIASRGRCPQLRRTRRRSSAAPAGSVSPYEHGRSGRFPL